MNRVNLREARRLLSDIVDAAERGETTVITRRGRQVARVEPMAPAKGKSLPDLSEFRASIKVKGRPLSQVVTARRKEVRY
ncbi:MAG: type II toxin-antitoxin system prevent-host-death family antitoxin [Planctomycetota bacterium]|nr:type II toxin-antitoxin system prevent-host-death family antitoxin [Planctomycetota bacterium]